MILKHCVFHVCVQIHTLFFNKYYELIRVNMYFRLKLQGLLYVLLDPRHIFGHSAQSKQQSGMERLSFAIGSVDVKNLLMMLLLRLKYIINRLIGPPSYPSVGRSISRSVGLYFNEKNGWA